jgi:alkyldihydroxyacetonephosphate synthase
MPHYKKTVVEMGIITDTFETAITWERFPTFYKAILAATEEACVAATGQKGSVSCRFTHCYPDGPAPYFSFQAKGRHVALAEQWLEIKTRALDAVLEHGGTVTHHHAIGRDHMPWYRRQRPELFGAALQGAKERLDPKGILNPGVLVPRSG